MNHFTLILWYPTLFQLDDIIKDIPNIIEQKEINIPKNDLHDFIYNVYKFDKRCTRRAVLPPKIAKLKEYEDNHIMIKFEIKNPTYSAGICNQGEILKHLIRKKYKSNIKGYIKDILIHVADDLRQSKHVWELCPKIELEQQLFCKSNIKTENYVTQRFFHTFCSKSITKRKIQTLKGNKNIFYLGCDNLNDKLYNFFLTLNYEFIVIFGTSDYDFTINTFDKLLQLKNLKYVYCQNYVDVYHEKIRLIPIGLSDFRERDNYYNNNIITNTNKKLDKIYISYHNNTHRTRRVLMGEIKKKKLNNIVFGGKLDHKDFPVELSKYKYALCLRGNGYDTHRFWESIWVNTIPIILRSDYYIDKLYEEAGCIIINNADELENIQNIDVKLNYKIMTQSYWENKINNADVKNIK